jgi:hypothetical protein
MIQISPVTLDQVVEAIYRLSGKAYALKILDKRHIVKEKKVKYVHVEKEALNWRIAPQLFDYIGHFKISKVFTLSWIWLKGGKF